MEPMDNMPNVGDEVTWYFFQITDWKELPFWSRVKVTLSVLLTPITLPFIGRSPKFKIRTGK